MLKYRANDVERKFKLVRPFQICGRVTEVIGPTILASMDGVCIGETVEIRRSQNCSIKGSLFAEVSGFRKGQMVLVPYGPTTGIAAEAPVLSVSRSSSIHINEERFGEVLDHLASPILPCTNNTELHSHPRQLSPLSPLDRKVIDCQLETGISSIDLFTPVGKGQRMAIYAEPGVGKTTLLSEIVKRNNSDVVVLGLIGERGREVQELVEHQLPKNVRSKTIIVCSTSDEAAARRANAAQTAISIADYFRSQGKDVLLLMDSLTRLVRAYREIGLASGEMPVRRGYPPSVFEKLPRLIEQAGRDKVGSITAFFTVLLSSELDEDPMVEEIKGLTDGHIILKRNLAEQGHYPALAIEDSLSRLESNLEDASYIRSKNILRKLWAKNQRDAELALLADKSNLEFEVAALISKKLGKVLRQSTEEDRELDVSKKEIKKLASEASSLLAKCE